MGLLWLLLVHVVGVVGGRCITLLTRNREFAWKDANLEEKSGK